MIAAPWPWPQRDQRPALTLNALADRRLTVSREGDVVVARLAGAWSLLGGLPSTLEIEGAIGADPRPACVRVENASLERWDSSLIAVLARIEGASAARGLDLDLTQAPAGAQKLLAIAREGGAHAKGAEKVPSATGLGKLPPLTEAIGRWAIEGSRTLGDKLDFVGSTAMALGRMLMGRTRRLGLGFTAALQQAGVETLPILALIAFASGAVLSLLAIQQLGKLGVLLLAPQLVAIVILRELGALTTGIALAGRLGSGIGAELATMVAGKEVDVLRTVGVSPFDLLVAPRVLALVLMGPLLVVYANFFGLLGSLFVGMSMSRGGRPRARR